MLGEVEGSRAGSGEAVREGNGGEWKSGRGGMRNQESSRTVRTSSTSSNLVAYT